MSLFGKFKEATGQKHGSISPSSSTKTAIESAVSVMNRSAFSQPLPETVLSASSSSASAFLNHDFSRLRDNSDAFPFKYSLTLSGAFHVLSPVLVPLLWALLVFLMMALFNINIDLAQLFPPPEPKVQEMEFVLVPDRKVEAPEDAKFLGQFNQEAGGEPVEKEPRPSEVSEKSPANTKAAKDMQANNSPRPSNKPTPQMNPSPKQQAVKPQPKQTPTPQPKMPTPPIHKVAIATPKLPVPSPQTPTKRPSQQTPQASSNPAPMSQRTTGPRTQASKAAQELASISQSGLTSRSHLSSQAGKSKAPGVNVRQADYGAYMAELKRRMARNWRPPRGERDKRVELMFEINRDGSLGTIKVTTSSGEVLADEAAINAVKISAPFKPLPPFHKGKSVPISFTFDYNVLGGTY